MIGEVVRTVVDGRHLHNQPVLIDDKPSAGEMVVPARCVTDLPTDRERLATASAPCAITAPSTGSSGHEDKPPTGAQRLSTWAGGYPLGMSDYEQSTTIAADPDALFAYLSDVSNLPDYFAGMTSAEPADGDTVHTTADVNGTTREGEAWFTAEEEARSIRWGSEGPNHYSGELAVQGAEGGGSQVTVRLHTDHVDGPDIDDGLRTTLAHIKRNVEGSG